MESARETRLDGLPPEAAVAVLRGWGVTGDDAALRPGADQVGHLALSTAVLGSYVPRDRAESSRP